MELGEKLRQARLEAGLSQRQLCGDRITRNMLSQIENGQAKPSMDTLRYLAAGLGRPVSYFLDEEAVASPNLGSMARARDLFREKRWTEALTVLEEYEAGDPIFEEEYWHLLSLCAYEGAEAAAAGQRRPLAENLLRRSLEAGARSLYGGAGTRALMLQAVLRMENPEALDRSMEELQKSAGPELDRLALVQARQALNKGEAALARALLAPLAETARKRLLYGESYLLERQYPQAAEQYRLAERLLEETGGDPRITYEPLETCFREMEDYKMAYFYAAKQK